MTSEDKRAEKFLDEMHRMPSPVTELAEAFRDHAMQKRNGMVAFTPKQLADYTKTMKKEQQQDCTAAVDMAFYHARSHGYTKEETESHVMMMCLHAGDG